MLLFSFTLPFNTLGQDHILTTDSVSISCRIESATSRLVHFTNLNTNHQDSLPTLRLRELHYADSLRVLIKPVSQRGQLKTIAYADFDKAFRQGAYANLLHAKTSRYDLTFQRGQVTLTTEGRRQSFLLITLLKSRANVQLKLTIHTDTIGKAVANKALTDRRATALLNFFLANGINSRQLTVEGRGESEVISHSQALNTRVELQVTAIDGLKELYGETYIPYSQAKPPTMPASSGEARGAVSAKQPNKLLRPGKQKSDYRFVSISVGATSAKMLIKPIWIDPKVGYGFSFSSGGFVSVDLSLSSRLSVGVQGAFHQWSSHINYLDATSGSSEFKLGSTLQLIPLQLVPRLYVLKSLYVAPQLGISHMLLTVDNEETAYQIDQWHFSYGIEVGFTFNRTGRIPITLSSFYQTAAIRGHWAYWYGVSQASYAGVRLGLAYKLN
ncbi:OmpA family protein [Spirosoma endophyticum]|uniref:OmpA family protein n=2 Tax=Spirosoma endophyticum TaxID=662367 RepID=A0A1I2GGS0_9BACT|nr:OmpA family protein [Spirosoma endophyticum]